MKAVITGDIVDSTQYSEHERELIYRHVQLLLDELNNAQDDRYVQYRGDSIQGLVQDVRVALRQLCYIKATINSIALYEGQRKIEVNIRLALGIGTVDFLSDRIEASDGDAFRHSGRRLDTMKKEGIDIAFASGDTALNAQWDTLFRLADAVMNKWTVSSAELVRELLTGKNESEVSNLLHISQPAVNLRKQAASWEAIHTMIAYYESTIVKQLKIDTV